MTYRQYLKEHSIWLKGMSCLVVSTEIFMLTMKRSSFVMGFLFGASFICFLICSYVEYRKMKQYVEELVSNAEAISEKYLLYEMIEREETQEQRHLKEIFYGIETETVSKIETLRRENTEYREFVETWVHEMKVPIAVIKMILANHKEADIGISAETERIEQYVEQALFYARSTAAEKDYLVSSVNLQKLAEQVILAHKRQLREMNAKIDLHDLDRDVYSDSKWLLFMVGQVVDNSIKYCTGNGTLVLEMFATESANTVCLHLKDNGIGIRKSELDRVFEKGFTGGNGRIGKASTGMGLYLCKNLCKKLEHGIEVFSREGEGTEIVFSFPMSELTRVAEGGKLTVL